MKIFQNKFFLICLCVAVVIAAASSTFSMMGFHTIARNLVGVVTVPVRWCITGIGNAVEGFSLYFRSVNSLLKENEALREENESLALENDRAALLEAENARLREYLDMKQQYPTFEFEEGMVISREASNYVTVLTLNRGTLHGVAVNMPVVTREGLVGRVTEVGLNWAKVTTLIESASSVGAYVPRSGDSGIVSGDYSMRYDGLCKVTFMDPSADVAVGDLLLSGGAGSIYPSDLVIGTVLEITLDEYTRTKVATVQPAVDFSDPQWMMIVTGY